MTDTAGSAPHKPPGRRAVQADQTRAEILAAARVRFGRDGYAATTVKDIAADAGVSVQTVYDSVGSKADLVRRLNDLINDEARVGEIAATVGTETDPAVIAGIPARITRRLLERCADILRAGVAGQQAEPELRPVVAEGQHRHRAGAASVAARLAAVGGLRPGLSTEAAATAIAALSDFRLAIVLLDDHAMSLAEVEAWIADAVARVVLAPEP